MSTQDIAVRGPGGLADPGGQGSEDIVTYAKWVVESGLFGRGITQAQAGLKMLVGRELGIQPLAAVRNIYIFEAQGRPVVILDATLMGAMVRTSGRYDYEVEQHDDEKTELAMYRLGPGEKRSMLGREVFTQQDAIKRKLANKPGPWNEGYAKEMRFARCLSRLVDHYAPELLLGLSVPVVTQDDADEMPMGHDQRKAIFAGLKPYEMSDDERHDWASDILGRRVDSFAEGQPSCPTRREATDLLRWLEDQGEVVTTVAPTDVAAGAGARSIPGEVSQAPAPVATHVTESLLDEPDDPELVKALRAQVLAVMRGLWSKDAKRWRPWTRFAVNAIRAGSYDTFPEGWSVAELTTLLDRMDKEEGQ